jgi:aryl-alcohol dehydrogenase-like predicted oxidoreductase
MQVRPFGNTSLRVSELGLGCARLGGAFQADTKGFLDLLVAANDAGINFFDTADMYSQGESEKLLGKALRARRDKIVIASKAGYSLPTRRRLVGLLKPLVRPAIQLLRIRRDQLPSGSRGTITQDFSPDYLTRAVEGSLRRLRTDYLDLFQLHSPPLEVIQRGEWAKAVDRLKHAGKVRYFGIAVDTVEAGLAALEHANVASVQFTLSLLEQRGAEELFPRAGQQGVAGIARECLANGLLVKPADSIDLKQYCKSDEEVALREQQLASVRAEAAAAATSVTKLALDYPLRVPGVSVTLVGARNVAQLRSLLRSRAG